MLMILISIYGASKGGAIIKSPVLLRAIGENCLQKSSLVRMPSCIPEVTNHFLKIKNNNFR